MKATLAGAVLADSDETLVIEGNHYFPPESVNWDLLEDGRGKSLCPWKGLASYYDAEVGGERRRGVGWTYSHPFPWIRKIRGHVAFWGPVDLR